jgi:hypothetical protein
MERGSTDVILAYQRGTLMEIKVEDVEQFYFDCIAEVEEPPAPRKYGNQVGSLSGVITEPGVQVSRINDVLAGQGKPTLNFEEERLFYKWYVEKAGEIKKIADHDPSIRVLIKVPPMFVAGHQMIAHCEVIDTQAEVKINQINWHGQNTSQWIYACGLVFDIETRQYSRHE